MGVSVLSIDIYNLLTNKIKIIIKINLVNKLTVYEK